MTAREETVLIESTGGSGRPLQIDRATSYEVMQDLTAPFEARLELGDNGTWKALSDAIAIGRRFRITLNRRPLIVGRLLNRGCPQSPRGGSTVQLLVRTWLADAQYTSCDPVTMKRATLKDVVVRAYATIGATERDFLFDADVARDVLTGRGDSTSAKVDLTKLSEQDARVNPPETVFSFVDRHLRRFGLMHWDAPDGRIVIGAPKDEQPALYRLQSLRTRPRGNNVLDCSRSEDYEQVPSELAVYGQGGGRDYRRARVSATVADPVLSAVQPAIRRRTLVIDESVSSDALAMARARRELAQRSLGRDSWDITVRGWTHWTGQKRFPYAVNTVADVAIQTAAAVEGPYFIWRIVQRGGARLAHQTTLTASARGIWRI
jgi:hypothetical protein